MASRTVWVVLEDRSRSLNRFLSGHLFSLSQRCSYSNRQALPPSALSHIYKCSQIHGTHADEIWPKALKTKRWHRHNWSDRSMQHGTMMTHTRNTKLARCPTQIAWVASFFFANISASFYMKINYLNNLVLFFMIMVFSIIIICHVFRCLTRGVFNPCR